ncbi:MAG: HD domain-containing protein [Desulfovibrionaceae bacterium]|nr:HD domain-containing protein [Desulfovibrionaceae bacterium]
METIAEHISWFTRYAEKEKALEKEDVGPMELKYDHTMRVLENARDIVTVEGFEPELGRVALLASLYHDIARFEQFRLYRTFKDRDSIDHGDLGVRILRESDALAGETQKCREIVLTAVGLHNRFELPATCTGDALLVTKVTRDADKLDIVRVIDGHLSATRPYSQTVTLQLPDDPAIASEKVIQAALERRVASYGDLTSVNDLRLLLASWLHDLSFESSKKRFIQQGYARHILEALPTSGVYAEARRCMMAALTP